MLACKEQKDPSDRGHRPARWISHPQENVCRFLSDLPSTCELAFKPAKNVARIFVDPCLCSNGFVSGPACLRRACRTPPIRTSAARSTWRLRGLHKVDKMSSISTYPLLMCTPPRRNPPSRRGEGAKKNPQGAKKNRPSRVQGTRRSCFQTC